MVLIEANRKEDIFVFEALAERLGLRFLKLTDREQRLFSRQKLVKITELSDENNVPDSVINDVIESIRANCHAEK